LLSAGLDAYTRDVSGVDRGATDVADEFADDMWDTAEDPAAGGPEDDYL
jgi:hypothetical protein